MHLTNLRRRPLSPRRKHNSRYHSPVQAHREGRNVRRRRWCLLPALRQCEVRSVPKHRPLTFLLPPSPPSSSKSSGGWLGFHNAQRRRRRQRAIRVSICGRRWIQAPERDFGLQCRHRWRARWRGYFFLVKQGLVREHPFAFAPATRASPHQARINIPLVLVATIVGMRHVVDQQRVQPSHPLAMRRTVSGHLAAGQAVPARRCAASLLGQELGILIAAFGALVREGELCYRSQCERYLTDARLTDGLLRECSEPRGEHIEHVGVHI